MDILAAETARRAKLSQAACKRQRDDKGRFVERVPLPEWLHPADTVSSTQPVPDPLDAWLDEYYLSKESDKAGDAIILTAVAFTVSAFIVVLIGYAIWRLVTL